MALAVTFVETWPPELREPAERVFAAVQHQLAADKLPDGVINIKLVDDTEIATLNKQYRGLEAATDVLTFNYAEGGSPDQGELSDIVISLETAKCQAEAAGTQLADEVGLLVAHGLLHALGYDHQTAAERHELDHLQDQILTEADLQVRKFAWKD
jgi:probable rRNA maturation factor